MGLIDKIKNFFLETEDDAEISTKTLIVLFVIALIIIALPYLLYLRNRDKEKEINILINENMRTNKNPNENLNKIKNSYVAPEELKACIDFIDLGSQANELTHQGLGDWEQINYNNPQSYGGPDNYRGSPENWRDILNWAGVILAIPPENKTPQLSLKINVWGNSFVISDELGKDAIRPHNVLISHDGYFWHPLGELLISGDNKYETHEFVFNSSLIEDKLYVKIEVHEIIKNNKKYGLTVNWICISPVD
ncbi:MAG: hypothetical protein ACP5OZ_04125 [Candidatus Woesearchaeota archaeon]